MKNMRKCLLLFAFVCLLSSFLLLTSCANFPFLSQDDDTEGGKNPPSGECKHENTEWIIDKNPTCSEVGSKHKECTSCKASLETLEISKAMHSEEIVAGTDATCTESGKTSGKICSVCKVVLLPQNTITPKGHTEEIILGKKPSCTEKGLSDGKKCSVCKVVTVEQTELSLTNHSPSDWIIDVNADIAVEGSKHKECLVCKQPLETEIIPALNESHVHQGATWIISTPASCTAEGEKKFICSCGKTMDTAPLDMIPHTEEILPAVSASCKATGLTEGKKCSSCGKILIAQTVTAKTAHTEELILGLAPTCTEAGLTEGKKCSVCTTVTVSQLIIPANGHSFNAGICTSCGINEPYGIWIVDGLGNPITDVIVKVMKGDEQIKMYPYKGEFLEMPLEPDNYQLVLDLSQLSTQYTFDESLCTLSPEKKTTTVRLFQVPLKREEPLYVAEPIDADYDAYQVKVGATKVDLTPNDYTFFVFAPTDAAVYTLTYECTSNLQISYHGGTFFVQGIDISEYSTDIARYENGISISVYASNLGAEYVIGVKSTGAESCIINIRNVGDPGTRIEDAPWTPYLEDEEKVAADLAVSKEGTYSAIDLTDLSVTAVYNENDGYYHLGSEDGPIIFIDLTSNSRFITSIQIICGNQRMGTYIHDINGKIVEKRSYNELFMQYGMPESADISVEEPVRVPLTAKLAEAIRSFGENNGWWDPDSEGNIFELVLLDVPYNQEYAWLLYCGYYS